MRSCWLAIALTVGVSSATGVRMSGPDLGGIGPAVSPLGSTPSPAAIALTAGFVIDSQGAGLPGNLLIAVDAQGHTVGMATTGEAGAFELTTPPAGPLLLTVYGTGITVPFEPGAPIVVVLP